MSGRRAAAAAILAVVLAWRGTAQNQTARGKNNVMELELRIAKSQYIIRESLRVEVVFRNPGPNPVSVPSLADNRNRAMAYHLTGPSVKDELVFQYARTSNRLPGPPAQISIAAGKELSKALQIDQYVPHWKPGQHQLFATLETPGGILRSKAVTFEIVEPTVRSAAVVHDMAAGSTDRMRAIFLAETGSKLRLFQAAFTESRPGLETEAEAHYSEVMELAPDTSAVASLWADFNRGGLLLSPRYVWVNRSGTAGVQEFQSEPVRFDLSGDSLLRPGLMTNDGSALLAGIHGREVRLRRIPKQGGTPAVSWQATLPLTIESGRVWITGNGKVTVLLAGEDSRDVRLFLVQDGAMIAQTTVEGAKLLPQSEPGLSIAPDGTVRASILVAQPDVRREVAIVDWMPSGGAAGLKRQAAATLRQDPKAAGVVYAYAAAGEPRRDWVIHYGDNIIVTRGSPARPRMLSGTPMVPLQLLPRAGMSFLLLRNPAEVLAMEPVF